MKILRKFLVFILSLFLIVLIGIGLLSYTIKNVVEEGLVTSVISQGITNSFMDDSSISLEQQEQLKSLLEDNDSKEIINNLVSQVIEKIGSDEDVIDDEVINMIYDYIIDHKDEIEKMTGEEIDVNEINSMRNSEDFKQNITDFNNSIKSSTNVITDSQRDLIKYYSYFTSNNFRLLIALLIVIDIVLISLIQWSLYKWLSIFGSSLASCGLTLLIMYGIVKVIINGLLEDSNLDLVFDLDGLLRIAIISIIVGIACYIVYRVISYIVNKNKNLEVAEVSTNEEKLEDVSYEEENNQFTNEDYNDSNNSEE